MRAISDQLFRGRGWRGREPCPPTLQQISWPWVLPPAAARTGSDVGTGRDHGGKASRRDRRHERVRWRGSRPALPSLSRLIQRRRWPHRPKMSTKWSCATDLSLGSPRQPRLQAQVQQAIGRGSGLPGHALLARDSDEVAEQARHRERVGPGKTDDFEAPELELDEEGIPAEVAADRSTGR